MKYFILCFAVGIIIAALTPEGWGLESRFLLLAACITVATIFYESLQNRN